MTEQAKCLSECHHYGGSTSEAQHAPGCPKLGRGIESAMDSSFAISERGGANQSVTPRRDGDLPKEPSAEPRILAVPIDGTVEQGTGSLPSAEPGEIDFEAAAWEATHPVDGSERLACAYLAQVRTIAALRAKNTELNRRASKAEGAILHAAKIGGPNLGRALANAACGPLRRENADLRAKLAERDDDIEALHLIVQGVKHYPQCNAELADHGDCLRCRLAQAEAKLAEREAERDAALKRVEELEAAIMADECAEHCPEVCCQSDIHAEARAILAARAARAQEKSK